MSKDFPSVVDSSPRRCGSAGTDHDNQQAGCDRSTAAQPLHTISGNDLTYWLYDLQAMLQAHRYYLKAIEDGEVDKPTCAAHMSGRASLLIEQRVEPLASALDGWDLVESHHFSGELPLLLGATVGRKAEGAQ